MANCNQRKKYPTPFRKRFHAALPPILFLAAALVMLAVYLFFSPQSPLHAPACKFVDPLEVHFIDVGQGDSTLLCIPGDKHVLIDTGPSSAKAALRRYLENEKVQTLDLVVFTHPHEDHIGGGLTVLSYFEVKAILMLDTVTTTATFQNLLTAIEQADCSVKQAIPSDTFDVGDASFSVLGPIDSHASSLNNTSVVLRVSYEEVSFLFSADAEVKAETAMLQQFSPSVFKSTVLKVGHHGSSSSTSVDYLSAISPRYAVISCGSNNDYGHPHAEILQRLQKIGAEVYRTDRDSTIRIETDGHTLACYTTKSP